MSCRASTKRRRTIARVGVALSCLVLAFSVLTGLFQANTRYFYCASMGLSRVDPCMAYAHRDDLAPATDEVSQTPFTCCTTGKLGAIPAATAIVPLRVPVADVLAVVPPPPAFDPSPIAISAGVDLSGIARERIPPRPARERRTQFMVFLT